MAKMRVYELAKELGVDSKDILSALNENGIEAKTASSGVDEAGVTFIKKKFGKSGEKEAPKKAEPKVETSKKEVKKAEPKKAEPKKEEPKKAEPKKAEPKKAEAPKEEAPKADVPKAEAPKAEAPKAAPQGEAPKAAPQGEAPKKKKNITVVINSQYATGRRGGDRRDARDSRDARRPRREGAPQGGGQGQRDQREGRGGFTPIRPRVESTVRPAVRPRPMPQTPAKKPEAAPAPEAEVRETPTTPVAEPIVSKPEARPDATAPQAAPAPQAPVRPSKPQKPEGGLRGNAPAQPSSKQSEQKGGKKDGRDQGKKGKSGHDKENAPTRKQERTINLEKSKLKKHVKPQEMKTVVRGEDEILTLVLPERMNIKFLCEKMQIAPSEVIKKLFLKGMMVTVNQDITYEQAEEIALEFNCICEPEEKVDVIAELLKEEEENEKDLLPRPPVVCVMGHVDHGKTSLLDAIRDTQVTTGEAGGITQKIGAYMVSARGHKITFLDTPGHEAFTAMRMRGASSTDIAILVVAADDGVMPQTVEAIDHARAAGVEIIVAINKIDKPGANLDKVKKELSEYDLISEEWGGSTTFVPVSAKTHEGIDELLDMVLLTAEVMELKADPKRNARGLVIEAELDKGRGVVATVLVQKGTLKVGDPIAAGKAYGKVRAMIDEHGRRIKKAGPSTPAEILGLSEVPNAGEIFMEMDSEKEARSFAETFVSVGKDRLVEESRQKMSLDDLFSQIKAGNLKELNLIVKADVQGSVEAVRSSLERLSNDEVVVKIIHAGVGSITESDVTLASASNAIIIGFNVRPENNAKQSADSEGIDVRLYNVIYNILDDVEAAMKGMLEPVYEEKVIGHAMVRQVFKASEIGNIAGSYVTDGEIIRGCKVRISRRDDLIFEGELASLRRFKDNVKEVKAGYECGLLFEGFQDFMVDDIIEAYTMVEVKRS